MSIDFIAYCDIMSNQFVAELTMTKMEEAGALLSAPMSTTVRSEVKFWRGQQNQCEQEGDDKIVRYKNLSEKFKLPIRGRTYERQFYHLYRSRLQRLKPRVEEAARQKFGPNVAIRSLCDLGNDEESDENNSDKRVLVVGTTFKHQELKPNILREISEDNEIQVQPVHRGKVCKFNTQFFRKSQKIGGAKMEQNKAKG